VSIFHDEIDFLDQYNLFEDALNLIEQRFNDRPENSLVETAQAELSKFRENHRIGQVTAV